MRKTSIISVWKEEERPRIRTRKKRELGGISKVYAEREGHIKIQTSQGRGQRETNWQDGGLTFAINIELRKFIAFSLKSNDNI